MSNAVIVAAARTAIGKFGGSLAKVPASELGAIVIKEVLARAGVKPDQVDEVIMGQVLAAGVGQNPARQAVIKSGLAQSTPAMTIRWARSAGIRRISRRSTGPRRSTSVTGGRSGGAGFRCACGTPSTSSPGTTTRPGS
jgi:acetyl-CoA acetyltransferase